MESANVDSGIPGVGSLPWGSHICQFYASRQDLADTLVPYFLAGIRGNAQCTWVTAAPLHATQARDLLRAAMIDVDALERSGQLEIIDYRDWYLKTGGLTTETLHRMWIERQDLALQRGYSGLRASGNTSFVEVCDWKSFANYEARLNGAFEGRRIVGLCAYCLGQCRPESVLDAVRSHQFAIIRRDRKWELIESSSLKAAKQELRRLNEELEERVRQRTAELEEALRIREDFISIASHELKTPLTSLKLYVESLLRASARGSSAAGQLVERLAKAKMECDRLERLVDYLLDFSRASSGQLAFSCEEMDLSELARATAQRFTESLRQAGCTLSLRADAPLVGTWDRMRIEQVLVNLLANAVKHAPGAPIEVSVAERDGQAVLSVRDHGPGIAPADQGRIFEQFVQLSPTAHHRGGFGLGLWLVRKIVEALRGTLDLESAPGEGSTFRVALPRAPAQSR
ncbi:MEDS domain-containing protein [Sorangium sp. So ce388]|uniref:MEDS domain-containing protein n=1 Tax=Sorangium sp. So ce388 TaxID=3133309 RepID=UPI003F5CA287